MNGQNQKNAVLRQEGFDFSFEPEACSRCGGRCCNGAPGSIYVDASEIDAISGFLGLDRDAFIPDYLSATSGGLSIKELKQNDNYACLFFDRVTSRCSIYSVRPVQCRTFPFWDRFRNDPDALARECPGVVFDDNGKGRNE